MFRHRWRRRLALHLPLALIAALIPIAGGHGLIRASACNIDYTQFYAAYDYSQYVAVDGVLAQVNLDETVPYVCSEGQSHTAETTGIYLPKGGDFIEMGEADGYGNNAHGDQPLYLYNGWWIFTYTAAISSGHTTLRAVQGGPNTDLAHGHQIYEQVSCPGGICTLYATYRTDGTYWPADSLPALDNPGKQITIKGEVNYDNTNQMGGNTFDHLQYHWGLWNNWSNMSHYNASIPYCNYVVNGTNPFSTYNDGPLTRC